MRDMSSNSTETTKQVVPPYLTALGAWALAFGCAVGWGSFVMPGTTFLPVAGPIGTALGIGLGALAMLVLGVNYHYLMNRFPVRGGSYTFTKECFGHDHGLLNAWFLVLTYIAIIWANATALPLIARTLFGSTFQVGFSYEVAGFQVYMGEILLAIASLIIAALLCLRRRLSQSVQIVMAIVLLGAIVTCFVAAVANSGAGASVFEPPFVPGGNTGSNVFTIFALAPWAYVGFESISHSAQEARFSLKHSFAILAIAIVAAAVAYGLLALLAVTALPEGCGSWLDYVSNLDAYSGIQSQPTFFAASRALGNAGAWLLGIAALCGIFTGLVGNFVALSRLFCALSEDGMLPPWIGELDEYHVPTHAILCILVASVALPFFGRTAISWIVDVTTVGATISYSFTSADAFKIARERGDKRMCAIGIVGLVVSLLFAFDFLVPNLIAVKTLATESYLILALWGILGFAYFRRMLGSDSGRKLGRSIVAWVVLLGLVVFTSSVWARQTVRGAITQSEEVIEASIAEEGQTSEQGVVIAHESLEQTDDVLLRSIVVQVTVIAAALVAMFSIYGFIQKRERQAEVEKALAEESSRAKTSFLSNMSHEIRTPMNAIIGLDSIALREPDLSDRTRELLEKIGASAKHLLGLINDILDMSRIESGRMTLKSEEFSLREFLDQVNIIINGQCEDKGLTYTCNVVGRMNDYYVGDNMKLKQVIINILGNSVKFTDAPGDVVLTVEQIAQSEESCTVRFTMSDTGVGMDEEYIPKLFDAFSQEDDTSTNRYGGSGLGMAITKNFVDMMDGDIVVHSTKGVGSVFEVTVVLGASDRSARDEFNVELLRGLRCLAVDDDQISCEHAQMVLRAIGIESQFVLDPGEALQLLREACDRGEPYDLLLTDYKMPGMDGLELAQAVRTFDDHETAIIILTGYSFENLEGQGTDAVFDAVLAKPLYTDTLGEAIQRVFYKKGRWESIESEAGQADLTDVILEGCRVLMAEDVDQNAEILEDLLDLEGVEAERAENGEIALKMFGDSDAGYYDAILMDVRMPVMDGLTAARSIRNLDRDDAKTIPIIAMTANVFDEDVERSFEAGMDAHLSKPVEPDRLYETMARLINRS